MENQEMTIIKWPDGTETKVMGHITPDPLPTLEKMFCGEESVKRPSQRLNNRY